EKGNVLTRFVHLLSLHLIQALADCISDLLSPFHSNTSDLVVGIDAMGFILGASVATSLGKGFLSVRKAEHLCVTSQSPSYSDYTGVEKTMEVRLDVLKPEAATTKYKFDISSTTR
uniref:adenine phosphoribosyltransferase n=1 Tax=Sander lucioperca TaxID=283035 RepID=A0A8C9XT26_SANLU